MPQTQIQNSHNVETQFTEPRRYNVILHNDDVTTMDFVVMILQRVFRKDADQAQKLMLRVHREGQAVAGTYSYDIAVSKVEMVRTMAKSEGFPLRLTIEEA